MVAEGQGGITLDPDTATSDLKGRLADLADARTLLAGSLGLSLAMSQAERTSTAWMDSNSAALLTTLGQTSPRRGPTRPGSRSGGPRSAPTCNRRCSTTSSTPLGLLGTGLPAAVREAANDKRLRRDQAQLQAQLATLDPTNVYDRPQIQQIKAELGNIAGILAAVDKAKAAYPGVMVGVLNYVSSGEPNGGSVAIAIGNPDSAQNVEIYQPGTSHGTASPDIDRGITMFGGMQPAAPGAGIATIVNISGPEPRNVKPDWQDPIPQASRDVYAVQVAQQTATDINGFQFLNPNAHVTVVAHSYATYVWGSHPRTTDCTQTRSCWSVPPVPGWGDASDLNADQSHVWSGQAPSDPINSVPGRFTPDPWSPFNTGQDKPSDPSWGAQRFDVGDGDHGVYFEPGSPGMTIISNIATGRCSSVTVPSQPGVPSPPWYTTGAYGPAGHVFG